MAENQVPVPYLMNRREIRAVLKRTIDNVARAGVALCDRQEGCARVALLAIGRAGAAMHGVIQTYADRGAVDEYHLSEGIRQGLVLATRLLDEHGDVAAEAADSVLQAQFLFLEDLFKIS